MTVQSQILVACSSLLYKNLFINRYLQISFIDLFKIVLKNYVNIYFKKYLKCLIKSFAYELIVQLIFHLSRNLMAVYLF